jgi:hypothetical protein
LAAGGAYKRPKVEDETDGKYCCLFPLFPAETIMMASSSIHKKIQEGKLIIKQVRHETFGHLKLIEYGTP